ncbi:MAG: DUF1045 domain-containing protein [Candidatus Riflebacteria bacterium]|nr:DUF1045 domain-containing protein [Candidatus Riflebacteria bacterium]
MIKEKIWVGLFLVLVLILLKCTIGYSEEKIKVNVFATVSAPIIQQVEEAGRILMQEEKIETFSAKGYQIHCTLYMTSYSPDKLSQIKTFVASFAQNVRSFDVKSLGISKTSNNWLFINLERNSNLQKLSDEIVKELSSLRLPSQVVPDWAKDDPEKVEYISKYGSPNVFKLFNPHLTLLAQTDQTIIDRFLEKHKENQSLKKTIDGQITGIGYGYADGAGQIKEPIEIFQFK